MILVGFLPAPPVLVADLHVSGGNAMSAQKSEAQNQKAIKNGMQGSI